MSEVETLLRADKMLDMLDLRSGLWASAPPGRSGFLLGFQLPSQSTLRRLRLHRIRLGIPEAQSIAAAFVNGCGLRCLYVSLGDPCDHGITVLAEGIGNSSGLEEFSGRFPRGKARGAVRFATALMKNVSLKRLLFEYAKIGEKGGFALGKLLKHNRSLRKLSLNNCDMGWKGCRHLTNAVGENEALEELHVRFCGMRSKDATRLAQMNRQPWRVVVD